LYSAKSDRRAERAGYAGGAAFKVERVYYYQHSCDAYDDGYRGMLIDTLVQHKVSEKHDEYGVTAEQDRHGRRRGKK
jgi:hypothetical protein